ncbi:MAG: hypothetical protein JWN48_4197 [Myxococcaceae bacterium]|nr:hypothetical protein [Myxococcaceae bacterium]
MRARALGALGLLSVSCTQTHDLAFSRPSDAGAGLDAAPVQRDGAVVSLCGEAPCACSNGRDDDLDGLIDGFDPECTSPTDQFEDSFATGVHGEDQTTKCQDCFFDDNSGGGDDGCARAHSCALDGTSSSGTGGCKQCEVEPLCATRCEPLVPNGCDCFGCCAVFRGGIETHILLSESCSVRALGDPTKCTPCLQALDCLNPCGRCELCPGRGPGELPSDCRQPAGGPGYSCDEAALCESTDDCTPGHYCQQGCCLAIGI